MTEKSLNVEYACRYRNRKDGQAANQLTRKKKNDSLCDYLLAIRTAQIPFLRGERFLSFFFYFYCSDCHRISPPEKYKIHLRS